MPSAAAAAASPTAGDERASNGRFGMRFGARDMRLPAQPEATPGAAADAGITRPAADAAGPAQDARFDLAMQQAGSGRGTMPLAPLERAPLEPTPGAAQAMTVARDWHHPLARTDAAAEATLRTAPDEAAFAPALGAQVALWVKDGVQQARLQLHPAELGPVTVQIALDGRAAHVDFTAAVAATRESIEQSLPALAAALRESGFTLAGGGVFGHSNPGTGEQGRERAPEGRAAGNRRVSAASGGDEGAAPGAALPRRWSRSLVDVYA
jgi:flagellar hook-length control protein FliK